MNPNREAAAMQEADDGPGRRRPQTAEHHRDMGAQRRRAPSRLRVLRRADHQHTGVPLPADRRILIEALSNMHSLFGTTREILRRHGRDLAGTHRSPLLLTSKIPTIFGVNDDSILWSAIGVAPFFFS